jgi:NAD(P)-dependent dehydrogenase (short-subunit alcohol dehydrogenase family)
MAKPDRAPSLEARVVVVTDADTERGAALARALVSMPGAVVVAGVDAAALGAVAAELTAAGSRVAVFADDATTESGRAALREMVSELFPSSAR